MEQMALYVLGGNDEEDSDAGSEVSNIAKRVDSTDGEISGTESAIGSEDPAGQQIPATASPDEVELSEPSMVPDATEEPWTTPMDLVSTLCLTATLVASLNLCSRRIQLQIAYREGYPQSLRGWEFPIDYEEDENFRITIADLIYEMSQLNIVGGVTNIERHLGTISDEAVQFCRNLHWDWIPQSSRVKPPDHTIAGQLNREDARFQDIKSRLESNVLLPLSKERPSLEHLLDSFDVSSRESNLIHELLNYERGYILGAELGPDAVAEAQISSLSDTQVGLGHPEKCEEKAIVPDATSSGGQDRAPEEDSPLSHAIQTTIINSLGFPGMDHRHEDIAEAHPKTFEWILERDDDFQRPWFNFTDWLTTCSGIYWINGKAGSGKSTFIEYIYYHPKTRPLLSQWCRGGSLTTAAFFFWNHGSIQQRSMTGLLRSLLHELLLQSPNKVKKAFPVLWSNIENRAKQDAQLSEPDQSLEAARYMHGYQWLMDDLKAGLANFALQRDLTHVCLFIDGLDECEGDLTEIVELLKSITLEKLKICLSSRPWLVFEHAFGNSPSLRLQDLTYHDIELYVNETLGRHPVMQQRLSSNAECEELAQEVVQKSDGVFLWVVLVVKSLMSGLGNRDSIEDLKRRLRMLPREMEGLYEHMLSTIDPIYVAWTVQMLQLHQIASAYPGGLYAIGLSFAIENRPDDLLLLLNQVRNAPLSRMSVQGTTAAVEEVEICLKTRYAGLLELSKPVDDSDEVPLAYQGNRRVQYLHRTVGDFVNGNYMVARLLKANAGFYPERSLLASDILRIKRCFPTPLGNNASMLWSISVTRIMELADAIEQSTGQPETRLLDELDRTISLQGRKIPTPPCTTFLQLATIHGLAKYLGIKLSKDAISRGYKPPYLYLALGFPWNSTSPHFETVSLLLSLGADPNVVFENSTIWQLYLRHVANTGTEPDSSHLNIIEELIRHGAGTTVKSIALPESSMEEPVADVIRKIFPHSDLTDLLQLINDSEAQAEILKSSSSTSSMPLKLRQQLRKALGREKSEIRIS